MQPHLHDHKRGDTNAASVCLCASPYAGNFLLWGCVSGQSPVQEVCERLQQAGFSPQQLLVSQCCACPVLYCVVFCCDVFCCNGFDCCFQSLLLSVWLQREKQLLLKVEESVGKLHTLLTVLCNLPGGRFVSSLCVCVHPVCVFAIPPRFRPCRCN